MALFVVRHRHDPAHCPAQDADMGAMLLNYLRRPNGRSRGVTIQGEAVVQGEHTMYMIVESADDRMVGDRHRHSWQWWELITHLDRPGVVSIRCRATDLAGRTQPETPEWNRLGYCTNAIQDLQVSVV